MKDSWQTFEQSDESKRIFIIKIGENSWEGDHISLVFGKRSLDGKMMGYILDSAGKHKNFTARIKDFFLSEFPNTAIDGLEIARQCNAFSCFYFVLKDAKYLSSHAKEFVEHFANSKTLPLNMLKGSQTLESLTLLRQVEGGDALIKKLKDKGYLFSQEDKDFKYKLQAHQVAGLLISPLEGGRKTLNIYTNRTFMKLERQLLHSIFLNYMDPSQNKRSI